MYYWKKLVFIPFYLASFFAALYLSKTLLSDYSGIFVLSMPSFMNLLLFAGAILLCSFFFCVMIALSQDWKVTAGALLISNMLCFIMFPLPENIILALGVLCMSGLIYVLLENKLKTYLTFQPTILLTPSIMNLSKLLIVLFSITYFFNLTTVLAEKPFRIPDELIDPVASFISASALGESPEPAMKNLSKQQLEAVKANPQLLTQFGLSEEALGQFTSSSLTASPKALVKKGLADQAEALIKPYQGAIPALFSAIFFLSFSSVVSLMGVLIAPLVWFLFYLLEVTGFTKLTKEMREVKKLVV
ncbi:hypothetical protein A2631_00095 [Candidatus Daviesbacteria bacterium RIFCSPHIGHO2_01_FULL_44_29]|uniref:Uncharacterized protein n=1 Tax=Candidatus Daviesbacteria bacterium RIFCSPHIGHO2_02_FULL_43_12 TaxID=1797776 RepID=A0A1F5KIA6_9BACT|nr:MAG: hypothetical protein A2631_00095 [Candidatus Daviesbacteria bacterium RIFCSPHIGHO2_01_FULL_44_29]OGE40564.1 MAG: hypothetical protein A3D25_00400 [Candidatus Daviesbacteria bacterium RIFCSPHIGHO2_02_FULL_43_12]OGE40918.1 MAG: hypothetical protein A3E86_05520 [Candidatus Daviesbacteria bacterium RIFCSPHIGHO2_12_FULL_47_45]OGE70124.1 MAG: hypothetical protein A3B55_00170 [Candidatus Daviesbacteria bacterium RIFCSPLOWO2_01_FULL_43_15]